MIQTLDRLVYFMIQYSKRGLSRERIDRGATPERANMEHLKYIRTDKNGTKIFEDWTCPRCGGEGESGQWFYTGCTCFRCGGSGLRSTPKIVKEYTDEYAAKLEARRNAKAAKYAEEHADEIAAAKAEQERKEAEWRKVENERTMTRLGCGVDGIGYVHTGNTYPVKDQIKANGGKWISQAWVAPVAVQGKKVGAVKINATEFINDYGFVDEDDIRDIIFCIGQRGMNYAEAKEQVASWKEER